MFRVMVRFLTFRTYAGQFLISPPCGLPHRPHGWDCFSLPFHGCCFGLLVYFVWTHSRNTVYLLVSPAGAGITNVSIILSTSSPTLSLH